ncbi:oligosaccharide flippase family protein [Agrobacterium tumefaciens]|uniref:oligosaccharide flippase family protein n=1 Tax=Agrobacterium tumefaciens TaxID=358 RepID=UPI001FFC6F4E
MHKVRRAFFMAMLEQHLGIAINFALIAIVSRLLSPAEVGFAVIGYGVTAVIFAFREFVSSDFLIQLDVVERDDINTSLTLLLLVSGILGIVLYLCGPYLAIFYHQPSLQHYLILAIAAVMAESLGMPAFSMLRRRLAFGTIARVRTTGLVVMAGVTIFAASNGWGFVSFSLGLLVGNSVASALAAYADPAQRTARLSLKSWRRMAEFGRYRGAATIVDKLYESLPQLVLGFAMTPTAVAIYNRANTVCSIPDRIFLSAIFSFAFPALAAEVREGGDVRRSYLRALSYITVLYWPSLIMVAILADPHRAPCTWRPVACRRTDHPDSRACVDLLVSHGFDNAAADRSQRQPGGVPGQFRLPQRLGNCALLCQLLRSHRGSVEPVRHAALPDARRLLSGKTPCAL